MYIGGWCTVSDEERLVAEIPADLKALVDADARTNKEIVQAALWREFGGERKGALDRRIEEQKRRISIIESEKNERQRELEDAEQTLEALKKKREAADEVDTSRREELFDKVRMVPREADHPVVQTAADELDLTPAEVLAEVYDK